MLRKRPFGVTRGAADEKKRQKQNVGHSKVDF